MSSVVYGNFYRLKNRGMKMGRTLFRMTCNFVEFLVML